MSVTCCAGQVLDQDHRFYMHPLKSDLICRLYKHSVSYKSNSHADVLPNFEPLFIFLLQLHFGGKDLLLWRWPPKSARSFSALPLPSLNVKCPAPFAKLWGVCPFNTFTTDSNITPPKILLFFWTQFLSKLWKKDKQINILLVQFYPWSNTINSYGISSGVDLTFYFIRSTKASEHES